MSEDDKKRQGDTSATMPTVARPKFVMPDERPANVDKGDPRREPSLSEPRRTPAGGTAVHNAATVPDGVNQFMILRGLLDKVMSKFDSLETKFDKFRFETEDKFSAMDQRQDRAATQIGIVQENVKRRSGQIAKYIEDVEKLQKRVDEAQEGSEVIREEIQRQSDHDMEHEARVAEEIIRQQGKVHEQEQNVKSIRGTVEKMAGDHTQIVDELSQTKEKLSALTTLVGKTVEDLEKNTAETAALKEESIDQTEQLKLIAKAVGKLTSAGVLFFQSPLVKLGFGTATIAAVAAAAMIGSCQGSKHSTEEQRYHQVMPSFPPNSAPVR